MREGREGGGRGFGNVIFVGIRVDGEGGGGG